MLDAMRTLSLDYLFQKIGSKGAQEDLDRWYERFREESPGELFPFLTEDIGTIEKVYAIRPEGEIASVEVQEMRPEILPYIPFIKPAGSQGAQIGPVIKRNYNKQKGASPSRKILNTTLKSFYGLAQSEKPWASYFKEIVLILALPRVRLPDGTIIDWPSDYDTLLECVAAEIGETGGTVMLVVMDMEGKWPGERKEYVEYLMNEKLAGDRYLIGSIEAREEMTCPLCGKEKVSVYPNALKGAGLNFINMDRAGLFSNIDPSQAWKAFPLCVPCADLLYVYKNHVIKKMGPKNERPFVTRIAGDKALVLPFTTLEAKTRKRLRFVGKIHQYTDNMKNDVESDEDYLLDLLKEEQGILNLTFLWADIGQNIENVTGVLTDVPPSRLRELSLFNAEAEEWKHPLFPAVFLGGPHFNMRPDLSLRALSSLFFRSGGRKAQNANQSKRLFQLKRLIAESIYHKRQIPDTFFWQEVQTTAQWWWLDAITQGESYGLLNEGIGKKGAYLTAAGWIRHLCWWLYYFNKLGVMEMENGFYEPEMAELKPYFGAESAINSREKAYAFTLGILYGRLLEIQGARGINVGSNALTWLKRLTLKGQDLPELYKKIRGKLLSYEAEKSEKIRNLITEIGKIGMKLPEPIELNQTQASYYLLLGQSMTRTIFKKEDEKKDKKMSGGEKDGRQ